MSTHDIVINCLAYFRQLQAKHGDEPLEHLVELVIRKAVEDTIERVAKPEAS